MAKKRLLPSAGLATVVLAVLVLLPCDRVTAGPSEPRAPGFLPTDPDFLICEQLGTNACEEMHPDLAYNEDEDEFLVVFDWNLNGASDHDIMAVTVNADGGVGSVFSVACGATYDDSYPAVARDPYNDSYLVVWQRREAAGDYYIYGSIVSDTVGAPFAITTWAGGQIHPDVAYATGSHHYLVVFEDHTTFIPGAPPTVRGRCLDYDGSMAGLNTLVIGDYFSQQTQPAVATNGFDYEWLVTWRDTRDADPNIYGREVSSLGACSLPTGSEFVIGSETGNAGSPDVAWGQVDPSTSAYGEFLVAWPEQGAVYGQRIRGSDFSLEGGVITVSSYDSDKVAPAVIYASLATEWWVIWADDRDYG
jgi:hypothetical protein